MLARDLLGDLEMAVSYKKLWKLLIDRDLKKKDLIKMAGISNYTLARLNKGERPEKYNDGTPFSFKNTLGTTGKEVKRTY